MYQRIADSDKVFYAVFIVIVITQIHHVTVYFFTIFRNFWKLHYDLIYSTHVFIIQLDKPLRLSEFIFTINDLKRESRKLLFSIYFINMISIPINISRSIDTIQDLKIV